MFPKLPYLSTYLKYSNLKMNNNTNCEEKVVIVTGSSFGIGEDAVINFARCGAQVVVTERNESHAKVVAEKCANVSPNGLDPLVIVANASKEEDCNKIINETIEKFTLLDVLVNNAGIVVPVALSDGVNDLMSAYDAIFSTNVRSLLLWTKIAIPHLEKTKGVIVNVSSIASKVGGLLSTPYYMSKAAVDSLTKCSAIELGPKGIRVVPINPAAIETLIFDGAGIIPEMVKYMGSVYPVRRIGQVHETSAAILFAASLGASFITGSNIMVDDGLLARMAGENPGVGSQ